MSNKESDSTPEKGPSSVVISTPVVHKDSEQGSNQQQPEVIQIPAPKFKHPTRMYGYFLIAIGTLIWLLTASLGSNSTEYQLGCGTCCMFYNAAFVCEILFYYNMMEHNQSHGKGTGWAVINIVLAAILTVIGLYFAFGMFTSKFSYL